MRRLILIGVGLLATQIAVGTQALGTSRVTTAPVASAPLPVSDTSFTQAGQELVWRVQLAEPFSPEALAKDHRTLCLLIERTVDGSVAGQACAAAPGRDGEPTLVYERISAAGPGPARTITAAVTRSSSSELTATFLPAEVGIGYQPLRWQVISTLGAASCAPPVPNRAGCYVLSPAKPELLELHTPQLAGCTPSGSSEVFGGPSDEHEIALTFDDGPWPDPPSIDFVNLLAREHVPATFFEIGEQIPEYDPTGSVERAMLGDGDMIGDHTWTHPEMTSLSQSAQRSELELTVDAIRHATGFTPCLWRPPYGDVDSQLLSFARSLGLVTIMWDVDPTDWATPGTSVIYQRVVSAAHNGAIVIQHFGGGPRYQTLAALPHEIATLRGEGYRFVTVAQLLGLKLIYR